MIFRPARHAFSYFWTDHADLGSDFEQVCNLALSDRTAADHQTAPPHHFQIDWKVAHRTLLEQFSKDCRFPTSTRGKHPQQTARCRIARYRARPRLSPILFDRETQRGAKLARQAATCLLQKEAQRRNGQHRSPGRAAPDASVAPELHRSTYARQLPNF